MKELTNRLGLKVSGRVSPANFASLAKSPTMPASVMTPGGVKSAGVAHDAEDRIQDGERMCVSAKPARYRPRHRHRSANGVSTVTYEAAPEPPPPVPCSSSSVRKPSQGGAHAANDASAYDA